MDVIEGFAGLILGATIIVLGLLLTMLVLGFIVAIVLPIAAIACLIILCSYFISNVTNWIWKRR